MKRTTLAVAAAAAMTTISPAAASADALVAPSLRAERPAVAAHMRAERHDQVKRTLVRRYERRTGEAPWGWTVRKLRRELRDLRAADRRKRLAKRREARYERVASVAPSHLQAIAACESGGNPRAVGGGGAYRGKYQFSFATWAAMGGTGDPAAASEAEQDIRAAKLYAAAGPGQWPVCGR